MKQLVEKKILMIDSDNCSIKLSNDDVLIDVPTVIMNCENNENEHIEVVLSEFTCNRDFESVDETNNSFSIFYNGIDHIYELDKGFPNVLDLDTQIKQDLEQEFSGETFTIQYLRYEGKIQITSSFTGSIPSDLALNFDIDNSCFKILGFSKTKHNFTIVGQSISLKSDGIINVLGKVKEIFIRSSLVNNNMINTLNGVDNTNILGKIPVYVAPLNNIIYVDGGANVFRTKLNVKNIVPFNIRLTTEDPNILIGLNSNFLMTLTFEKYQEKLNTTEELLQELLEIEKLKFINKNKIED